MINIIVRLDDSQGEPRAGTSTFVLPRHDGRAKSRPPNSRCSMMTQAKKKSTGIILLAALAGAGVGALPGVLLGQPPVEFAQFVAANRAALLGEG